MKSKGQIEYEADVDNRPLYHDGAKRSDWKNLDELAKWSWEKKYIPKVAEKPQDE